jgi:hypothetical protein
VTLAWVANPVAYLSRVAARNEHLGVGDQIASGVGILEFIKGGIDIEHIEEYKLLSPELPTYWR